MLENLLLKDKQNIAIYGAGMVADILFFRLSSLGYRDRIKMFLVTDISGNEMSKFGLDVVELSGTVNLLDDCKILIATKKKDQDVICSNLENYGLCNYIKIDSELLIDEFFADLQKSRISEFKVLGQNQRTAGYGDNPKYIFEELHKRDTDNKLDLVWSVSSYDPTIPEYIRQVEFGSYDYYKELATAHIWIDNSRKSSIIRKRKGQYYIQAWHGAAPIKKVEADAYDSLSDYYISSAMHDSEMADLFISGSKFYTDLYKKSFWYDGEILESGLPRQDVFWDLQKVKKSIHKKYEIDENVRIALYAPTFRAKYTEGCYGIHLNDIAKALEEKFEKKFVFLVSRHPNNHIDYTFASGDKYIEIDRRQDFEEVLAATDVLITDYSGCMYDFSFTKKPIFLFQSDYEEYLSDRNFYISMNELPYVKARSNEELIEKIKGFDNAEYIEKLDSFMEKMGNYDDGTAASKVVDYIIDNFFEDF